jgi:hypothetical protein
MQPNRNNFKKEIQLMLGLGMINLEADPEHLELATIVTIDKYRQRSSNSMQDVYINLEVQREQYDYQLDNSIQLIRQVYRRGAGSSGGSSGTDPFSLAWTNNIYMTSSSGGMGSGGTGTLATYDYAMQYQELAGRLFGKEVVYRWDHNTHILSLDRKFLANENILIWAFGQKPDEILFQDVYARSWLRDYAVATLKIIIGEARSKFQSLAGPQGGITLNGDSLKSEGFAAQERLEAQLHAIVDQNEGYGFVIG